LQYGVSAYNWEDVTVTGNTFVGCGSGVRIRSVIKSDTNDTMNVSGVQTNESQPMRNITVTGNTFRDGLGYDNVIIAQGEVTTGTILNLSVVANTIDTNTGGQAGIRVNYVSRCTVADNVVANAAGTGISCENQNNSIVNGNVVWTCAANGITMVSSDNSTIVGNQVRDAGNNGILLQTSSDIQVRDNFVKGAGRLTNATYFAIRLSDGQDSIALSGNKCRPSSNTNRAVNGLSIGTGTNMSRYGNDVRPIGGTWTGSTLVDNSTATSTAATDLTV
jgi:parallel beta-helix repeat protein